MTTDDMAFQIVKQSAASLARTGVLKFASQRLPLQTPGFVIPTSRGAVPHTTPDMVEAMPDKTAFYIAAEDFLEKLPAEPPILKYADLANSKGTSARDFFCLPPEVPMIASVRKSAPELIPKPNSDKTISVVTSEGCRDLPLDKYIEFVVKLKPDAVLACPDFPHAGARPGGNRVRKMLFRTERWFEILVGELDKHSPSQQQQGPLVFAPVLPAVDLRAQGLYLDFLKSQKHRIAGITVWNAQGNAVEKASPALPETWGNTVAALEAREMGHLPRYNCAGCFQSPFDMLNLIATSGADIFNGDLATVMTDAGVALDFTFPAPVTEVGSASAPLLGFNLWEPQYKVDTAPFGVHSANVCSPHNRAFIHHLLDAHEMTAWVLLQKHNLAVLTAFFNAIRESIEAGTFESDRQQFEEVYKGQDMAELRDRCKDIVPNIRSFTRDV